MCNGGGNYLFLQAGIYVSVSGCQFGKRLHIIECIPFMFYKIISDGSDCSQNISFTSGETIVMLKLSIFVFEECE